MTPRPGLLLYCSIPNEYAASGNIRGYWIIRDMAGIEQYIEEFRKVLAETKGISYAFIFGSSIKALRPGGDIDILAGGRLSFSERVDLAMKLELIAKRKVDVVLSEEASPEIIMNAFSKGLKVFVNNKETLKKDYFKNLYAFEDGENLRRLRMARIKRKYDHGG